MLTVLKSGNLNLLEPSGPVLACNGTDFFYYDNQQKECKMDGICTKDRSDKILHNTLTGNVKEKGLLGELEVDEIVILKWFLQM